MITLIQVIKGKFILINTWFRYIVNIDWHYNTKYFFHILGLTPNTLYKIRVKAGTVMGYPDLPSDDSQWVEYRTAGNTNGQYNTGDVVRMEISVTQGGSQNGKMSVLYKGDT